MMKRKKKTRLDGVIKKQMRIRETRKRSQRKKRKRRRPERVALSSSSSSSSVPSRSKRSEGRHPRSFPLPVIFQFSQSKGTALVV
jgi:hypothetical protein